MIPEKRVFFLDNEICKGVDEDPHAAAYLIPHPEDCSKYYSCQKLGFGGGYIAHLMNCPLVTGFDEELRICNHIRLLPRCNKGNLFIPILKKDGPFK